MTAAEVAEYLPSSYERVAVHLEPYRFRLAATSMATFALLFGFGVWAFRFHPEFWLLSGPYLKIIFSLAWVIIVASWSLFLSAVWFHPSSGVLRRRRVDSTAVAALLAASRVWASFVLSCMFLAVPVPLLWFF